MLSFHVPAISQKTCFWYRVPDIFNLPFIYFTKLWFRVVHHHSKRPHSFHVEFHENLWLSLVSLSQIYIYLPQRVPPLIFTHKIIFKVCLYFFNAFSSCQRVITKSLGVLYCRDLKATQYNSVNSDRITFFLIRLNPPNEGLWFLLHAEVQTVICPKS